MSDQQVLSSSTPARPVARGGPVARFLAATELDTRLLGMVGALLIIWIAFNFLSDGRFLTPRNLWNLSVQTASITIMATGMVLVIVTRNIDLSVGSILGFTAMIMGVLQVDVLPRLLTWLGVGGLGHPSIWVLAMIGGILVGAAIGTLQGSIIAYLKVPAFIVTLGGFLIWRGAAWWVTAGRTISPLDGRFQLLGGGPYGAIGATWSWVVAAIGCVALIAMLYFGREQRRKFHFPVRPMWAEITLAVLGCGGILGAVTVANAYPWPELIAKQFAEANGITVPAGGLFISHGIAIPVLIAIAAAVVVSFIARRTRFGRYIFAIGGNPEAAELAGINTRWVTVKVYMLMGALVGLSAAVASARLQSSTNALGELDELYVIAAAVIGGTSLSGGVGTVVGAVLGAVVMQSLQSGMVLIGLDSPLQKIVVGVVLVFAVWLDTLYRRRAK
jgi:D-xylose transport system permease protein